MGVASKLSKMAVDRTKKFLGLPGYDESTEAARKSVKEAAAVEKAGGEYAVRYRELAKKEKAGTLTKEEKKEFSSMLSPKEEKAVDRAAKRSLENKGPGKPQKLSEKEKKQMQESLEYSKGGAVKKYSKGGMGTKANCGASMKPSGGSRNK
jgi:hypothetical protein